MNWVLILWICTQMSCSITQVQMEDRNLCMAAAAVVQEVKLNVACIRVRHEGV